MIANINWAREYFENFTKLAPLIPRTTGFEVREWSPKENKGIDYRRKEMVSMIEWSEYDMPTRTQALL